MVRRRAGSCCAFRVVGDSGGAVSRGPAELGSPGRSALASAQSGAGSIGAAASPEPGGATPTSGAVGRPDAPIAVDPTVAAGAAGLRSWSETAQEPRPDAFTAANDREPVPRKPGFAGVLGGLVAALEEEELRQALIREARARVNAATEQHAEAVRTLERIERRGKNARATELARDAATEARLELSAARRQLIRSVS